MARDAAGHVSVYVDVTQRVSMSAQERAAISSTLMVCVTVDGESVSDKWVSRCKELDEWYSASGSDLRGSHMVTIEVAVQDLASGAHTLTACVAVRDTVSHIGDAVDAFEARGSRTSRSRSGAAEGQNRTSDSASRVLLPRCVHKLTQANFSEEWPSLERRDASVLERDAAILPANYLPQV